MKNTTINFNLDGLEDIKRQVGSSRRARVGVIGSGVQRDDATGITNAELMLIHMLGSFTHNLPPRDPLLMPIEMNKRELIRSLSSGSMRQAFMSKDYNRMFELLGAKALEFCMRAFETGGFGQWPQLQPETIKRKGSSAILIDHAEMRKSMSWDVVKQSTAPSAAGVLGAS